MLHLEGRRQSTQDVQTKYMLCNQSNAHRWLRVLELSLQEPGFAWFYKVCSAEFLGDFNVDLFQGQNLDYNAATFLHTSAFEIGNRSLSHPKRRTDLTKRLESETLENAS